MHLQIDVPDLKSLHRFGWPTRSVGRVAILPVPDVSHVGPMWLDVLLEVEKVVKPAGWPKEEFGWNEEDYFASAPEGQFCEFKDGTVFFHSPVTPRHQDIVGFLQTILRMYAERTNAGKVFAGPAVLRLRENLNREPDIFYVSSDKLANIKPQFVQGPAEFVVEVTPPGTRRLDLGEKVTEYAASGVQEYWVIDLEREQIVVHRLSGRSFGVETVKSGRLSAQAIAGFWVQAEWFWRASLPDVWECLDQLTS